MLSSGLIGILGGLLLGGRFKVFALVAIECAAALMGILAAVTVSAPGTVALAFLVFSIGLQAGYAAALFAGAPFRRPLRTRHSGI